MNKTNGTRSIVALASIASFAGAWLVTNARADTSATTLTLSVYLDTAGADSVLAGDYGAAIRKIESHGQYDSVGTLAAQNNLCVAYTMTRQWNAAQTKCDAAVAGARMRDTNDVLDYGASRKTRMAIAYSNRAVLNWLQNQPEKAVADVTRARSLAPKLPFVARNWTALNERSDSVAHPAIAAVQR